jgi:CubicO group peptidase (beta-lactamase class C family)
VTHLLLAAAYVSLGQANPASAQELDTLFKEALPAWRVPGLAVVIVHDDRVVYVKGFGVRELGKDAPVTPDTVFPLASCTKPFTTLAMALLKDDGKLDWDDPVKKHLPWFKLADPLADAHVTLRDLVSHRTGVGRHDALWYRAPWSVEERVRKLAFLEPSYSFRSRFAYQTIGFDAAGLALASAAGALWHEVLQRRVFGPLEMKATTAAFPTAPSADLASPHRAGSKGVAVLARYPLEQPDPAGSVHTTARDLGKFLRFQLAGGALHGRRLISPEAFVEMHTPQIVIPKDAFVRATNPDTFILTYGLGWIVQDYRGLGISLHGGAIDGFRAQITLVPDAKLGIALLNNLDNTLLNLALTNTLIDRFCGLPAKDWSGYLRAVQAQDERTTREENEKLLASRRPEKKRSLPLERYVGDYVDRAYGTSRVTLENGRLIWRWSSLNVPLEHFGGNTFLAEVPPGPPVTVTFTVGAAGAVESLQVIERTFRRLP